MIVSAPANIPVTRPPDTLALPLLAFQVPPVVVSVNGVELPIHTVAVSGDIAAGAVTIFTVAVAVQIPFVYVIVSTPELNPVTIPPDQKQIFRQR